jgi:hypothetical protein
VPSKTTDITSEVQYDFDRSTNVVLKIEHESGEKGVKIHTRDVVHLKFIDTNRYIGAKADKSGPVASEEERASCPIEIFKYILKKADQNRLGVQTLDCVKVSHLINDYRVLARGYTSMIVFVLVLAFFMGMVNHNLNVDVRNAQNIMLYGTIPLMPASYTGGPMGSVWSMFGPTGLPAGGLIQGTLLNGIFATPRNYSNVTYQTWNGTLANGAPWNHTAASVQTGFDYKTGRVLGGFRVTVTPKIQRTDCVNPVLETSGRCFIYKEDLENTGGLQLKNQLLVLINQTFLDQQMAALTTAYTTPSYNESIAAMNLNLTGLDAEEAETYEKSFKKTQKDILKDQQKAIKKQLKRQRKSQMSGACTGQPN